MADDISELPTNDNVNITPAEQNAIDRFLPSDDGGDDIPSKKRKPWKHVMKLALYAVILFAALANPFTMKMLKLLPYAGTSDLHTFAVTLVIYVVAFVFIYRYWM